MGVRRVAWPAWVLAAMLTAAFFLALTGTRAHAASPDQTVKVGDAAESYYTTAAQSLTSGSPVSPCTPPVVCPPTVTDPPSAFPAETLHVGVAAGAEEYRTYISPDLGQLLTESMTTTGRMILPVATDPGSGTIAAEQARMSACIVAEPAPDGVTGSTAPPPAIVPGVCQPLQYDAKTQAFSVDVTPFLDAWTSGEPQNGVALIPTVASQTDNWQVTLNGRHRAGAAHIATIVHQFPASTATSDHPGGVPAPPSQPPSVTPPPPSANSGPDLTPSDALAQAPVVAGAAPQPPSQAQAFSVQSGFLHPTAFLIPVGLLILGTCLMRVFTADPAPVTPEP